MASRTFASQERGFNGNGTSNRLTWILVIFAGVALIWAARLVFLHVVVAGDYSDQAAASRTVAVDLSPRRGTIYDRNGKVLATSVEAITIYANPKDIDDYDAAAINLASVLGGKPDDYKALISQDTTFVYIERKADKAKGEALKDMGMKGIYFVSDVKRVYPYGQIAGQILGFVGVDDEGLTGLELYYDDILKGTPGRLVLQQGQYGISIPGGTEIEEPAVDGEDIVISIDIEMQTALESYLASGVENIGGKYGNAILYDAATGEILAIASTPYFNPNDLNHVEDGATTLRSITSQFEPGSVFKTVSATALMECTDVNPDTEIGCPVEIEADEYTVSDAHERPAMTMTLRQIIYDSSNVGISLMIEDHLGFTELYNKIVKFGLNDLTGVDYPGEASGYLTTPEYWSHIQQYNVTFGQGVSVTPLQITRFYGAIANGGVACTPHFLISKPATGEVMRYETERVIEDPKTIKDMTSMLVSVVTDGTGRYADIDDYWVAGKTGTAEYADEDTHAYLNGWYNLDFVGFLPDSSTPLVCFVAINEVPYERNACGVFKDIMEDAIDRYRITQD